MILKGSASYATRPTIALNFNIPCEMHKQKLKKSTSATICIVLKKTLANVVQTEQQKACKQMSEKLSEADLKSTSK